MPRSRTKPAPTPADDFTHDAIVVRTCAADGGSYNGFKYPLEVGSIVTCPDWKPTAECGNGFHGLLNGIGDWGLVDCTGSRLWQVIGVLKAEIVEIDGGKVKFPRGKILYCGSAAGAMAWFVPEMVKAIQAEAKGNTATGNYGHAAATGKYGHAAATGKYGHAAATGNYGHAAATGNYGHAAATGKYGHAAATGKYGHAAATGDSGHAAATSNYGHAAATGKYGHAAATGKYGHAAATGDSGHAAATSNYGHAAATGDSGHAAATGKYAIAAALGVESTAMAGPDGWIVLAAYNEECRLVCVKAAKVGGPEGIEPNVSYRLTVAGEFVKAR